MSVGPSIQHIEDVDAFARQLYRRARASGPDFQDIATVVRGLHTVLKHLRVEAEDPDSLLNIDVDDSSLYARQLTPIVEDCEFTLKQLDTILEKYGGTSDDDIEAGNAGRPVRIEDRERDMISLIRTKLANQKTNIDMFLDTVQLHNPSKGHRIVEPPKEGPKLDNIKDKVDEIAARLFRRRSSAGTGGSEDEEMWLQFRDELEKEGFSRDVLRKNKEILRAYIRQLDERAPVGYNGPPPSVRGFLEHYQYPQAGQQAAATNYPAQPPFPLGDQSPKEMFPANGNEKFFPSMKMERLQPDQYPPPPTSMPNHASGLSYEPRSSSEEDDEHSAHTNNALALISTRDLMALDKRQADLNIAMQNMHLQPHPSLHPNYTVAPSPGTSPSTRYLPPNVCQPPQNPSASDSAIALSSSPSSSSAQFGISPRYVPSLPPPPYSSSPAPTVNNALPPPPQGAVAQRYSRLAPDSQGHDIPLDAKWTRIRRTLVSPQVLERAGVRYEARPDFVAVLGELSPEQIKDFARQSAEVRSSRSSRGSRNATDGPSNSTRGPPRGDRVRPSEREKEYYSSRRPQDRYRPGGGSFSASMPAGLNNVPPPYTNGHGRMRHGSSLSSDDYSDSDSTSDSDEPPHYRARVYSDDPNGYEDEKGTKSYPFIVSPPKDSPLNSQYNNEKAGSEKDSGIGLGLGSGIAAGAAASPSATVKPKPILKNKNDDPHVRFDPEPEVLGTSSTDDRSRDRSYSNRDRERDRHNSTSKTDRYRPEGYRHRDGERRHHHHHGSSRRDRDDYSSTRRSVRREDRDRKKSVWGETARAVGIGGAAASLLSVLTEAATGL